MQDGSRVVFLGAPARQRFGLLNEMLRAIGVICLLGVIVGPAVWIADILGVRMPWITVREAFILMLAAFLTANAVVVAHIAMVSNLPKRQKWHWLHRAMLPFTPFAALEYLMRGGAQH
jgi:uncharacterized membrane protein YcjF (UPF0283 family)